MGNAMRTYDEALFQCVVFAHAYDSDGLPDVERVEDGLATALAIVYGGEPSAIYEEITGRVAEYEPSQCRVTIEPEGDGE